VHNGRRRAARQQRETAANTTGEFDVKKNYLEIEKQYSFDVYPKRDIVLVRGEGATVWDDHGNAYLDCVSGHGVSNLGHGNRKVIDAIRTQAEKLITCSNVLYNDQRALFMEKLIQVTPANLTRTFLCNSGTEAIEAALKFTRFTTKKSDFICAMRAFHGRTFGAMSATFKPEYKESYEPLVPGFHFVPFNDFEKIQQQATDSTAGIILEVVQGEGGVNIGSRDYFTQVRKLCDDAGLILIIDEIQSGFCRTGKMFACEHFDLQPDILCLAKAIAGGLPMGAVVCSDKLAIPVGKHGTTFGGNPLSCAAARATIEVMEEENLAQQALEKGDYLVDALRQVELHEVREIRHLGLMIGIELNGEALPVILDLLDRGVLVFPAGKVVIRVFPPLTISYEDLDRVIDALRKALG